MGLRHAALGAGWERVRGGWRLPSAACTQVGACSEPISACPALCKLARAAAAKVRLTGLPWVPGSQHCCPAGLIETGMSRNWLKGPALPAVVNGWLQSCWDAMLPHMLMTPEQAVHTMLYAACAPASQVGSLCWLVQTTCLQHAMPCAQRAGP